MTPYTEYTEFQRLPREVMESFQRLAAAVCHDTLAERGHVNLALGGLCNLTPGRQVAGQAVTVRFVPTRLNLREKAAEIGPLARDKQEFEAYIRERVVSGSDLAQDIYPATEAVKREYVEYRRKQG